MTSNSATDETARQTVSQAADQGTSEPAAQPVAAEELLIEEISIDGMCGVY